MIMNKIFFIAGLLFIVFSLSNPVSLAWADDDYSEARQLRESGEILPLEVILKKLRLIHPGKILEVELEKEHGKIVYEIEILGKDGVVREIYMDARSGDLLSSEKDD